MNYKLQLLLPSIHLSQPNPSHPSLLPPQLFYPSHDLLSIHFVNLLSPIQHPLLMLNPLLLSQNNHIAPLDASLPPPLDNRQPRSMERFQNTSPTKDFLDNITYVVDVEWTIWLYCGITIGIVFRFEGGVDFGVETWA